MTKTLYVANAKTFMLLQCSPQKPPRARKREAPSRSSAVLRDDALASLLLRLGRPTNLAVCSESLDWRAVEGDEFDVDVRVGDARVSGGAWEPALSVEGNFLWLLFPGRARGLHCALCERHAAGTRGAITSTAEK